MPAQFFDPSRLARAIGAELRHVREEAGVTRPELSSLLPSGTHIKTLAEYERGHVRPPIERFVEICQALGAAAPIVLAKALEAAAE